MSLCRLLFLTATCAWATLTFAHAQDYSLPLEHTYSVGQRWKETRSATERVYRVIEPHGKPAQREIVDARADAEYELKVLEVNAQGAPTKAEITILALNFQTPKGKVEALPAKSVVTASLDAQGQTQFEGKLSEEAQQALRLSVSLGRSPLEDQAAFAPAAATALNTSWTLDGAKVGASLQRQGFQADKAQFTGSLQMQAAPAFEKNETLRLTAKFEVSGVIPPGTGGDKSKLKLNVGTFKVDAFVRLPLNIKLPKLEESYLISIIFTGQEGPPETATRIELTRKLWWQSHVEPLNP